ncbi:MAG: S8 family serine peptidase [Congregibacter sp.]
MTLLSACGGGGGGGGSSAPAPVPNVAPTAQAGEPQTIDAGTQAELDASGSSDSDGSISSFLWTQSDGPSVDLQSADQAQASFVAPDVSVDTTLVFTVTVTDNDGATATDSVSITLRALIVGEQISLSGRILPSASQSLDGDTNDPFNPLIPNSDPSRPQPINNPTTLGGYVNEPGAGAEGESQVAGDREDYFSVELLRGQNINLLVAQFQNADADLYLYSADGELIDFSIDTGQRETLTVAQSGQYLVNVSIFSGATNYTLTIGSELTPVSTARYNDVIPDEVILRYRDGSALSGSAEALLRRMRMQELSGGRGRERLMNLQSAESDLSVLSERLGAQRFRRNEFTDSSLATRWRTLMGIKHLQQEPDVASAEPNYRVRPLATVNDAAYGFQWHYPLINIPGAWDTSTGDPSVIIAVVDTGVLSRHPDLLGQLTDGYDFIRDAEEAADGDGIDPDPEEDVGGSDPTAVNFHGSHVSGTIAAAGNNGIGVAGVAFSARVMPLRALTSTGGTSYDVIQAVRFAAGLDNDSGTTPSEPAQIINLSLSGGGFSTSSQNLFNQLHSLGISVVAAAGNENTSAPAYPASYANVISVSAVDLQQRITAYSNTGSRIDVSAPGGDGGVDLNGDGYPDGVLSTGGSGGDFAYTFLSGTSMAAPHVAGIIALMKSVNPDLNAGDIDRLLESGALTTDLGEPGRDDLYGHGLIDARRAIDAALAEAGGSSNSAPRLSASSNSLNFSATGTRLELVLSNSGAGELASVVLQSPDPWISIDNISVNSAGLGRYAVRVDRSSLAPGIYEGTIIARSSANSIDIRVLLSVANAEDSNLGQIYLLLFDPATDSVVSQAVAQRDGDGYRFSLPPVNPGNYQFFAGTDLDNDLLICDEGEACGSYLTIDQPLTLTLDRDRNDIDFQVEYLIALPGAASNSDNDQTQAHRAIPARVLDALKRHTSAQRP